MLQPFEHFKVQYIDRLIELKKFYLVAQSYPRGANHFDESHKIDILLTDYESTGPAEMHLNAVRKDKYGSIIDLSKAEHKLKLLQMLEGERYELYWCIVRSNEELIKRIQVGYKDKMRRFIQKNTDWKIGGDEKVDPIIEVVFGELYIKIKWRTKALRIKFEEIERF